MSLFSFLADNVAGVNVAHSGRVFGEVILALCPRYEFR
jgi:uncharacterized protein involved in propanediol utilization